MENDRTFPSASTSEGSSKVMSRYWPDLNVQSNGFSKLNAVVPSAISCLLKSLAIVTGEAVVVVISSRGISSGVRRFNRWEGISEFVPAVSLGGFTQKSACSPRESGCDPATRFQVSGGRDSGYPRPGPLSALRLSNYQAGGDKCGTLTRPASAVAAPCWQTRAFGSQSPTLNGSGFSHRGPSIPQKTCTAARTRYFSNTFSTWPTFFWTLPASFSS